MHAPKRHAANCQWARQTLEQPHPIWLSAADRPWTCERGGTLRPLESTEPCEDCPHWDGGEADTGSQPSTSGGSVS
jgi:hypothetical protein